LSVLHQRITATNLLQLYIEVFESIKHSAVWYMCGSRYYIIVFYCLSKLFIFLSCMGIAYEVIYTILYINLNVYSKVKSAIMRIVGYILQIAPNKRQLVIG